MMLKRFNKCTNTFMKLKISRSITKLTPLSKFLIKIPFSLTICKLIINSRNSKNENNRRTCLRAMSKFMKTRSNIRRKSENKCNKLLRSFRLMWHHRVSRNFLTKINWDWSACRMTKFSTAIKRVNSLMIQTSRMVSKF